MGAVLEGKYGNWYEHDHVVLQHLRLLAGEIDWLQWEGPDERSGVDLFFRARGHNVAAQYKHRSRGTWALASLQDVLRYARKQLERTDPDRIEEFRFVSDSRAPILESVVDAARKADDALSWDAAGRDDVLKRLDLEANRPDQLHKGWELCRRIFVETIGGNSVKDSALSIARLCVAEGDPVTLCEHLREFARKHVARRIGLEEVLAETGSLGMTLRPHLDSEGTARRVARLREEFLENVEQSRDPLELGLLERTEAAELLKAVDQSERGGTIVLHGPAGCGKSTILASAISRLTVPVLPLRAERDVESLVRDPVATMAAYCGDRPGVLVLDQLDQLFTAGNAAQPARDRVRRWIREARRCGLVLVAGCRTVDAEQDTQLRNLLAPEDQADTRRIRVRDLDEAVVVAELAKRGIAAAELGQGLLRLLSQPLALGLFLGLRDRLADASRCRTTIALMQHWWDHVSSANRQEFDAALDALAQQMEATGQLSCAAELLEPARITHELCQRGIFQKAGPRGNIRPFHQLLTDSRIAVKWGSLGSLYDLLQRIGNKQMQSVAQARRLRLAVPFLAERALFVREIFDCPGIRPLLKHALLVGISELDDPAPDIVDLVREWIGRPHLASSIVEWVAWNRPAWARLLEPDLQRAWDDGSVPRDTLLRFLGSVDDAEKGMVDRCLTRWAADDPDVLDRARLLFRDDPATDSDARFEERLRFEALTGLRAFPSVEWGSLVASHPARAVRLFGERLRSCRLEVLKSGDPNMRCDLPDGALQSPYPSGFGERLLRELAAWWSSLACIDLYQISPREDQEYNRSGVLAEAVDFLAAALAADLRDEVMTWDRLLRYLPDPLRELDAWLLLTIAAHLPEDVSTATADRFAEWFMSDPELCWIDIGPLRYSYDLRLMKRVLQRLGKTVSEACLRRLEIFLIDYRDEWTVADEARRGDRPNLRGRMASILLPMLPEHRRSAAAERLLQELRRKFEHREIPIEEGFVTSSIPDEVAERLSKSQWLDTLDRASRHPRRRFETLAEFTVSQLSHQIDRLARRYPQRFLPLALEFDADTPLQARAAILSALGCTRQPDGQRIDEWAPLEDHEVAVFLERDCFLDPPELARELAWTIHDRPTYDWSSSVIDRLSALARNEDSPTQREESGGLLHYRLNDQACAAVEALAAVARHHAERRPRLFELAEALAVHTDPARRASAAMLAMACAAIDPTQAHDLVLRIASAPAVAAELDVARVLFRIAIDDSLDASHRLRARDFLLSLVDSSESRVQRLGGDAAFELRMKDLIDDHRLSQAIAKSPEVARGVAAALSGHLRATDLDEKTRDWMLDLALRLADVGGEVGAEILHTFRRGNVDHLLGNSAFVSRLLASAAAKESLKALLEACDRSNHLLPVADLILSIAARAAERRAETWEEQEEIRDALGLVSRLVEETEAAGSMGTRAKALDCWDVLLEASPGLIVRSNLSQQLTS